MSSESNNSPCCPFCRGTNLYIVGAVVTSPSGIRLEEYTSFLEHKESNISREVVKCADCNKESSLVKAKKAAEVPTDSALWQINQYGNFVPIICPKCGNKEYFGRRLNKHVEEEEHVVIQEGVVAEVTEGGDSINISTVTSRYDCAVSGCDGYVAVDDRKFDLLPT